jgi:hypothetical protein
MQRFHVPNETSSTTGGKQVEVIKMILDGNRKVLITAFSIIFNEGESILTNKLVVSN